MLRTETVAAVAAGPLPAKMIGLDPADEQAYSRLVRWLWAGGVGFVVVEQDVAPTRAQLETLASCGHDWCGYVYGGRLEGLGGTLGCTRFSARLITRLPYAADQAFNWPERKRRLSQWRSVDQSLARRLRLAGVEWVAHDGRVKHLHPSPPGSV